MVNNNIRRTAQLALLVAAGLIIFTLEGLIPPVVPVPGAKIGFANVVTLFTLYAFGGKDAVIVLFLRIALANAFGFQLVGFWYSISGGVLCLIAMNAGKRFFNDDNMQFTSILGGVFHNIGQILAAVVITENALFFIYAPVLIFAGIICGLFTGLICKAVYKRLKSINALGH